MYESEGSKMQNKLKFNRFLVYSDDKCFTTEFGDKVNIVIGKNTSGKSTFLQSLLFTLGINDVKHNLQPLLNENVIFRLDCILKKNEVNTNITFVRDNSILIVKDGERIFRFNGIDGNSSEEHKKLKSYLRKRFDFDLILESKGELKEAPLETMFLPYYISQSVGWVYLQRSFSNLDYYKNFRDDYFDYYLGIVKPSDRVEKSALESKLRQVRHELHYFETMMNDDVQLTASQLNDENFQNEAMDYLLRFNEKKRELKELENAHTKKSNQLSLIEQRRKVLQYVGTNQNRQNPVDGECPTCQRKFDFKLDEFYMYQQSINDTNKQKEDLKLQIIERTSSVNSLFKKITNLRNEIEQMYNVVCEYQNTQIKFDKWLDSKATLKLGVKIKAKVIELKEEEETLLKLIRDFKTDEDVIRTRVFKEKRFKKIFTRNLQALNVKPLEEVQYNDLYKISAFPSQGVELHKTVMSYHFAFNELASETDSIHRLPFLLDAVFKEDIENENRELINKFIRDNSPKDTQTIFSVAFATNQEIAIHDMTKHYGEDLKIIVIADLKYIRSLLHYSNSEYEQLIQETNELIVEVN